MPLVRTVRVNINESGAEDVKAKLDRVALRADELARMDPTLKVDVDTAAATARLAILAEEMRRVDHAGNQGFRFNVGSGLPGFLGSLQKGLNSIISMGPAAIPVLAGIALAVGVIITTFTSLLSVLTAATVGVGAFAAFTIPTFAKIVSGIQAVSDAAGKVSLDGMVKGITDAQKAADKLALSKAWAAIPADLRPAVKAGLELKDTFDKMVKALRPDAVKIFADAIRGVRDLLPFLLPIAKEVAKAIDGLLRQFDNFTKSAGFASFMNEMRRLAGPAVTAIGKGLGQVAGAIGDMIKAGDNGQGIIILASAFTILAGAIRALTWAAKTTQSAIFGILSAAVTAGKGVIRVAKFMTDAFLTAASTIAHIGAMIPGPFQSMFKKIAGAIDSAKRTADNFFADTTAHLGNLTAKINNANPIYKMKGDISDLHAKVAAAKASLASVPPSKRTRIWADIAQAQSQIAAIRMQLAALNGTTATTYVQTVPIGGGTYLRHAAGGPSSGLTWVGEQGPELVYTPPGSYVYTNQQSQRMAASGTGRGGDTYNVYVSVPATANPRETARHIAGILNQGAVSGVRLRKSILAANG
jgi:hypothetical protein